MPVGVFGVISDIYILGLPIPTTLKLNLPLRKRLGVIAIFMIGFVACLASIIGLWLRASLKITSKSDWTYTSGLMVTAPSAVPLKLNIAETN
ncbi:MAG: hypothetical protein HETSPECPRED_001426 [Heterodermia speciosa]|uniref:Rhodopsin domain-containing protein n=1 Tax=Heterodermia speciosa TaxID=116794 RepID=A0A8H3PF03_9LECA|nr:MAG: hypothetical protein HETSPECPRED_001426 [Heterodermia speciosa]